MEKYFVGVKLKSLGQSLECFQTHRKKRECEIRPRAQIVEKNWGVKRKNSHHRSAIMSPVFPPCLTSNIVLKLSPPDEKARTGPFPETHIYLFYFRNGSQLSWVLSEKPSLGEMAVDGRAFLPFTSKPPADAGPDALTQTF